MSRVSVVAVCLVVYVESVPLAGLVDLVEYLPESPLGCMDPTIEDVSPTQVSSCVHFRCRAAAGLFSIWGLVHRFCKLSTDYSSARRSHIECVLTGRRL